MDNRELVGAAVRNNIKLERIDVVRAKRLILDRLADGQPHPADELARLRAASEDGLPPIDGLGQLTFSSRDEINAVMSPSHPVVRALTLDAAGWEALAELGAAGLIVPVGGEPGPSLRSPVNVSWYVGTPGGNESGGVQIDLRVPCAPGRTLRLPHKLLGEQVWHLDADLFAADLTTLGLDARTLRCVAEALQAYRRDLFLACASLLGAASEGAWFAAAELLGPYVPGLGDLIDRDATAQVQTAVADAIRATYQKRERWVADELIVKAELLRSLRNYGVHPRGVSTADLDRWFDEAECGLLILTTHRYLIQLVEAVQITIAHLITVAART